MNRRRPYSSALSLLLVATAALLVHCESGSTTAASDTPDPASGHDAGGSKNNGGKKDGGTSTNPDPDPDPDPTDDDGGTTPDDDSGNEEVDSGPSGDCSAWKVGTLTGYNNSNLADDPNAGSVMEYTDLNDAFYDHVPMAAVDMSDWNGDKYHWVDIKFKGKVGRVGVWDACSNQDCPDGTNCCTDNKRKFANPGYLLDVEARTAKRLWGVSNAEDTLQDKIEYRICDGFDPDAIANQYGANPSQ